MGRKKTPFRGIGEGNRVRHGPVCQPKGKNVTKSRCAQNKGTKKKAHHLNTVDQQGTKKKGDLGLTGKERKKNGLDRGVPCSKPVDHKGNGLPVSSKGDSGGPLKTMTRKRGEGTERGSTFVPRPKGGR